MLSDQLALLIPIIAIAGAFGMRIFRAWTQHEQEMTRLRRSNQAPLDDATRAEIEALRREIAELRDTTTKYDLSVEHTLTEVQQRLGRVESLTSIPAKRPETTIPTYTAPVENQQNVGLNG